MSNTVIIHKQNDDVSGFSPPVRAVPKARLPVARPAAAVTVVFLPFLGAKTPAEETNFKELGTRSTMATYEGEDETWS